MPAQGGDPSGTAAPYPVELVDELMMDFGAVRLRPIRADDAGALVAFHEKLSRESQYLRFFTAHPHLSAAEIERFTNVDYRDRLALVAELDGQIIGVARYDRIDGTKAADVAFVVADAYQCRGLGAILLRRLADAAARRGVERFTADTLVGNQRMQAVFRDSGFDVRSGFDGGVVHVSFPIVEVPATVAGSPPRRPGGSDCRGALDGRWRSGHGPAGPAIGPAARRPPTR